MTQIRIGIIGIGNMGSFHAQALREGKIPGAKLGAVCDVKPERLRWARETLGEGFETFEDAEAMIKSGTVDGVIIATPHYEHPRLAILAFENNLHVLTEKPAGVYTRQVEEMNRKARESGKVFGIMYNQRTNPVYQKMRELVQSGELGELKRTNWIITDWYRPQSYYDSGSWRATWAGEGGGVLLNQCPHNLDLWQWVCGMPVRVRAFMSFGKYHNIEVEDDVTAYVEYENGATGMFITSTGEFPGSNRFEIMGEKGKAVVENGQLSFWSLRTPEREFNRTYTGGFGAPELWKCEIPIIGTETAHVGILNNWTEAIQKGTPLLSPGYEGIRGLTLSNAMHLSAWTDQTIELPLDENLFYELLSQRIKSSKGKESSGDKTLDVKGTY